MKKGKILLSLSILAALGSFSAPLSWAADVTNPEKTVNTTVEGNVSAGVAENEGDNAVSNILTLDTGADISGNATGGVAVEGAGNALTNTVDVLDTAKVAGAVTGGVSYDGNAKENVVNMTGGTVISGVTGGRTFGTGEAAQNQVTILGAVIGEATEQSGAVFGGVSAKGMANNNVVKIMSGTTTYENVMGGYSWESSASENQVFLTGTNTIGTSVFGGDGLTGASNNELTIEGDSTIGEKDNEDTGYAIGGFTHTGTALSNKLTVKGGTMNYAVGGLSDQDGSKVESNELTITGGTIYTEAAGGLIDGKVEYEANGGTRVETEGAAKNIATISGGEVRNLSGGRVNYYATGDAIANEVYVSDAAQIDYLVRGGSTYYGNANNNIVEMTGGTAGMGVEGGESVLEGDANGNHVTVTGAVIGVTTEQSGVVFGGLAKMGSADDNVVEIKDTTTYENVIGGFSTGASANGNKVTLSGTNSIGTNIYGGDGQTGASNNELILEDNSTIGVESNTETGYAAGGFTHTGDVLSNKLTVEGGTMNYAIGGYTETGGNAEGNELTVTGGTVYVEAAGGTTLGTGDASGNQATVSNATIGTETQAGTVYGGHAAKGSADDNVVKLTDTTTYGNVMGGLSDGSSASGNKVTLSGTNTIKTNVSGGDGETGASNNELILEGNSTIGTQGNKDNGYATGGNTTTGTALSNKLTVEGGTMNYAIGGYADRDGSRVEGNTLTITGGTVYQEAAGGMIDGELEYKENGGTLVKTEGAVKNIVKMSGGQVRFLRGGAVTQYAAGDAIANEVYVSGDAQIDVGILGGSTYYGNANNNIVEMTGGTVGMSVVGAYSILEGDAVGNHVTISNAVIGKEGGEDDSGVVAGAEARKGNADNNVVELTDTITYDNVVGGNSWEASASGNKVTILGTSSIGTHVFGGVGKTGAAENTVIIGGSTQIGGAVIGAQAEAGDAERNTVFIQGGTIAEDVVGGDALDGNANDNAVIVTGGTINGDIIGGISNPDSSSGNTIIIAGGTINGDIIGSYGAADGSIIGNTVDILGGTFGEDASLYGGLFTGTDYGTIEGNTLNFAAEGITVKNLANFQNINFYIDKDTETDSALLTVTNVSYISEASVHTFAENTEEIKAGGAITLLSAPKGILAESTEINGTIIDSNFLSRHTSVENDGNNLILNVSDDDELFLNQDTKLFAETRAAGLALVGNGSDAAAVQGFEAAKAAYGEETGGFAPYASIGGFNLRHETGSYVDTNGMAANLGFARQYERDGYVDTLMPFFEYGRSDYTSHLGDGARGDGDQHYTGGGILYRRDRDDGLHYEAMIRAGRLSGDFKGNIDGIHASYDSDASYIAAEAGLGKVVSRENTSLDYYGKFFYTRLGSDSTVIHNSQKDNSYDFDSINSYRTRLGVRWTKEINKKESCYAGIGWDYEFDSDARASWRNFNTPTPTMEGSSGFLELGWKSKMTKDNPWSADFNLTGWAGKQRGITYTLGVSRAF